ncbi:MAG: 4-phosphoerythronate dehydrogenase, partial [Acidobacteria bacterium]|nr:4-phosphoerythronate dehydrogenase [Acidobacteriota bacterium]
MIIAVDEKIPYWDQSFVCVGDVRPFDGRKLGRELVADADALVVRSVTAVDASLLEGSSVRFVGTATIGMDHLDESYLRARGIHYMNAAGSNANAVAEWMVAALLVVAERRSWDLKRKSLAVIGVGQVGSRVVKKARSLGMEVLLCDPPLRESTGDRAYQFLEDVIEADLLTLHVPLTTEGRYPTWHMFDERVLGRLGTHQFLFNSARGAVIDNNALRDALMECTIEGAVLDVWENEPRISYDLVRLVDLATPHNAGYSIDGKVRGTEMILEGLCRFFGIPFAWDTAGLYPPPSRVSPTPGSYSLEAVRSVVLQAHDILETDASLRGLESLAE